MQKTLVYDLPTRLFHWIFASLFICAYTIASIFDDESAIYPLHMMMGMTMLFALSMRFIWGLVGSKYARFSSFILRPSALIAYFKTLFSPHAARSLGRNPASSWAAITMMGIIIGLGVTGYLMTQGINKHFFKEIHELLANGFLAVVIAHITGVIIHTHKHHDQLALSMVQGSKPSLEGSEGISHAYRAVGMVFLACVGAFVFYLSQHYNTAQRNLQLFGIHLQLGEVESEEGEANEARESSEHPTTAEHENREEGEGDEPQNKD